MIRIKLTDPLFDDDDDDSLFKTDELLYYINNALREAVFRGKMLVKDDFTISLVAGTSSYPVPNTVVQVTQILDENKHDIVKIQEVDFGEKTFHGIDDNLGSSLYRNDWRNDTGDLPTHYMQNTVNNTLVLYPIPTRDSIVTLRGSYIVEDLIEADSIPIALSAIYHPDLIYWVLFEAFDKPDADTYDPQSAEKNKQRFIEVFGEKLTADQFQEMLSFPDDAGSLRDY